MRSESEIRERLAEVKVKPGIRSKEDKGRIESLEWVLEDTMSDKTVPCETCGDPIDVGPMHHTGCLDSELPDFEDQELKETIPKEDLRQLIEKHRDFDKNAQRGKFAVQSYVDLLDELEELL